MSNDVYGYLVSGQAGQSVLAHKMESCAKHQGIGLAVLRPDEVYGLPSELMPTDTAVCFRISDSPAKTTASYLIDMVDYAADIGMPRNGRERLGKLTAWLEAMTEYSTVVVAMSDENEVEGVTRLKAAELWTQLLQDFAEYAPPNRVYVVS